MRPKLEQTPAEVALTLPDIDLQVGELDPDSALTWTQVWPSPPQIRPQTWAGCA